MTLNSHYTIFLEVRSSFEVKYAKFTAKLRGLPAAAKILKSKYIVFGDRGYSSKFWRQRTLSEAGKLKIPISFQITTQKYVIILLLEATG